ncbi:O-antigen ligase family protein [Pseudomonas lurida]|uniref:O-antigen ligase family protein n=1 Tax=Pseudomonas lurida TaxID=244566 RepID=UPI00054B02BC|nr:O-antigen ligase family protein [Pseudomonas lurida]
MKQHLRKIGILTTVIITVIVVLFTKHSFMSGDSEHFNLLNATPNFTGTSSDTARTVLINSVITEWLKQPIFGQGLGYYFEKSNELVGFKVTIHNTLLWLLTEFGIVGAGIFLAALIGIGWQLKKNINIGYRNKAVTLLLMTFIIMSLFHEVLYQRIFWFMFGALIAVQYSNAPPPASDERPTQ